MATAGLAKVVAGDAHPLVLRRRGEHRSQQLAALRLQLRPPPQRLPRLGNPLSKRVAHLLQLLQPGDPRLAKRGWHAGVEGEAREGLGAQMRQLPFQAADLPAQLDAGKPLVARHLEGAKRLRVSVEQVRHSSGRV